MFENFTPVSALGGGVLIGVAAAVMLWLSGRVMGVSGIAGGLLRPAGGDTGWRLAFVIGLVTAPLIGMAVTGSFPPVELDVGLGTIVVGGLLVGFGTRFGGGCTSGHGICGIGRLSARSIAATGIFMAVAGVTVYVTRHLLA